MSFINVETEGLHFRVVLGNHFKPTNPIQIQKECTGMAFEANVNTRRLVYDCLTGTGRVANCSQMNDVTEARKIALQRSLPMIMSEPLATPSINDFVGTDISIAGLRHLFITPLFPNPIRSIRDTHLMLQLAESTEEIQIGSNLYKNLQRIDKTHERCFPNMLIGPRNLIMAERAYTLASHELQLGLELPSIAIFSGALHVGIVEALLMTPHQRAYEIKLSKELALCYESESLGEVLFVQYIADKNKWTTGSIIDRNLQ